VFYVHVPPAAAPGAVRHNEEDAMANTVLDADAYQSALGLRDLTDSAAGPHAMQLIVALATMALCKAWGCPVVVHRESPIVTVDENYNQLHYPSTGAARDVRYTRYITATTLLRTHTSAMIPTLLRMIAHAPYDDVLLACPGIVYRRDTVDRLHCGEPHQLDLWRIRATRLGTDDLQAMIRQVVEAMLPGAEVRSAPATHPYTVDGLEIRVRNTAGDWVEIGECGLALPALLAEAGLDPQRHSGLAMGLGLDRILMLRKGIDDIRLLRSPDPRIAQQMLDLTPYRRVSSQPAVRRDLSIATAADTTKEELGDRVRTALGNRAESIEAIEVLAETPVAALPAAAATRLGISKDQKNVLLRVVLRHPSHTLTDAEANLLRDEIYKALHEGGTWQWAGAAPPP
jgi:phenylalanyl-tRNA synthetase alpha chain